MITCYELMRGPKLEIRDTYDFNELLNSSEDIADMCREVFSMGELAEERAVLFAMDTDAKVMGVFELSKGNTDSTMVDIQSVFTRLLLCGSKRMILAHNHPSQNNKPSRNDIKVTQKLKDACDMMDFIFVDHIIVTKSSRFSFNAEGLILDNANT